EVTRWCRLVRCAARRGEPAARPSPGATIVPAGAAYGSKRWPPGRFAAVARGPAPPGHDLLVTGYAAARALAASVASHAGLTGTSCLAGRTGLSDLAALVQGAALVISGDTGVAHLASAYERPSVVLFGPASPRLWGPPDKPIHAALRHGDGEREVLADAPGPALLAITPGEVLEAAARVPGH